MSLCRRLRLIPALLGGYCARYGLCGSRGSCGYCGSALLLHGKELNLVHGAVAQEQVFWIIGN